MVKTRALRDEPPPGPDQPVFRGILGDTGLVPADLRQAAALNHELYGFYGVSVWVANIAFPRELLECHQAGQVRALRRIHRGRPDRVRASVVGHRAAPALRCGVRSYDLESLVARLAAAPYRIVDNPSVDREEH
jgi:hypothetical protein